MAAMRTTTLGGIILHSDVSTDGRTVTDMKGWDDAVPARSGMEDRAQQDGAWDATGHRSARVVDIKGSVRGESFADAHAAFDQMAALDPRASYELVVDNGLDVRSARVRVTIGVRPEWGADWFDYALTVKAPDPLKYGPPTFDTATLATATPGAGRVWPRVWPTDWGIPPGTTPGALVIPNAGTAPYWPRLRIDGPVTNPVVTCVETGAWVRFNGDIVAGQWIDWDLANRRVLLQGQVSMRHLVTWSGDWLATPVGGASYVWTADTADPAALLSAWGREAAYS